MQLETDICRLLRWNSFVIITCYAFNRQLYVCVCLSVYVSPECKNTSSYTEEDFNNHLSTVAETLFFVRLFVCLFSAVTISQKLLICSKNKWTQRQENISEPLWRSSFTLTESTEIVKFKLGLCCCYFVFLIKRKFSFQNHWYFLWLFRRSNVNTCWYFILSSSAFYA